MAKKYKKAPKDVTDIAKLIIKKFHPEIEESGLRVDFLMAYGERDENKNLVGDALKLRGNRAFGIASITSLKDRTKGLGDAEILLDADWWEEATIEQRQALVDHELNHFAVVEDETDELSRPVLKMRKHDVEVGWFKNVAERHGVNSLERVQAKQLMDECGQIFWPAITGLEATGNRMQRVVSEIDSKPKK